VLKKSTVPVSLPSFDIPSAVLTNENGGCLVLHSTEGIRIVGIGPDGQKTEIRYNPVGNLAPNNCHAQLARDGKSIFIFGTANNAPEPSKVWCGGFMVSRLDVASFKLSKPLTYTFDEGFVQSVVDNGGGIKHKKVYSLFDFDPQLLEMENGDIVLVGSPGGGTEQVTQEFYDHNNPNGPYSNKTIETITLHVGPVVVLFPDMIGKAFDQVIIPRQIELSKSTQAFNSPIIVRSPKVASAPTGLLAIPLGDDIVILYNDNPKNLAEAVDEKVKKSDWAGDLELGEALINKERKLEYRKLISKTDKHRATYYLGDAVPTNTSSIIFPIGKEFMGMGLAKTIYTNWCFVDVK
jgi:hypothetical protein